MNIRHLLMTGAAVLGLVQLSTAQAVVPGWETDPTAIKEAFGEDIGYQPPEALRYPYVSTYYVKPTVTPDEDVKIGFYVTDFEHSKIRFLDDSHRFTAYLEYRARGGAAAESSGSTVLTLKDLKSGDGEFNLGKLPIGEYELRVWAVDHKGRESHRVIQDFRVVSAADRVIPVEKVYTMTAADLATYGIRNDGDFERVVCGDEVVKEKRTDVPGYTVTVPLDPNTGRVPYRAYEKVSVEYDAGYDTAAVEQAAVATAEGLQRLIDDKAAAGYRKLVLHPGTYRVSHTVTLTLPDRFTLDLGEATIKLNQFAGESSLIFNIASAYDAHLVGGTVEGDYWAHDYANSDKDSEWVSGIQIGGDSWYSSVENVKVVDITGYGGQNGIASDARGGLAFIYQYLPQFAAGGLDPKTGAVDTSDTYRFTTDFKDLTKVFEEIAQKNGRRRLQICKYLGYQGIRTRSWQMTVCWYDAERKFLSSETCWQYREMWIPANAQYLRVSIEEGSVEAANGDELVITGFRLPVNCAVKNCTFEHCRCVGYAASAMRNMLFEGNFFTRSGEAEAKCAFDAEDGADQMQDVYFLRNRFRDNPINNSILTCAGHNFILEKNDGGIYFWGRTHSPCVRDNDVTDATYYCDSRLRSGYARFGNNRYSKGFKLGLNDMATRPDSWDYVLSEKTIDGNDGDFSIEIGKAGRAVGCTFRNLTSIGFGTAYACVIENCKGWCSSSHLQEVTVRGNSLIKPFYGSNFWENCHIQGSELNTLGKTFFTSCDFTDALAFGLNSAHVEMTGCMFANSSVEGNWWEAPAEVVVRDSVIDTTGKPFLKLGVYTVGDVLLEGCTVTGAKELVNIRDLRRSNEDPGTLTLRDISWGSDAMTVVTHPRGVVSGETLSTKEITFVDQNASWPEGVEVVTELLPTWRLVKGEPIPPDEPTEPSYDWYVSPKGSDKNDGLSWRTAFATIAKGVEAASEGQTVGILAGTHELDAEIVVNKAITLVGAGWDKTVVRPAAGKEIRCVTLDGGAKLERVTLTGGKSSDAGAGAWIKDGTLSWCCVSNNATTGGGKSGGGVSFTSGKGRIDHSIVTGCTIGSGSWGAGIGGKGGAAGPVLIDACLVYGNEDKSGSGGGIGFQNWDKELTVRNCTITGNKCSNGNGHGLYLNDCYSGANLVLVNAILSGNVSGTTECNTFIARKYFDGAKSSHCLITGTQEQYNGDIYKDKKIRGLFADADTVLSDPPTFVDAVNGDYRLVESSTGAHRGVRYDGIGLDLNGEPFAAKPSIGCYECGAVVEDPEVIPATGTVFRPPLEVTLACATAGATIRYTTDGSDPTEASAPYAKPLSISDTVTVKARAFKSGMDSSGVVVATYLKYEEPVPPVLGAVTVVPRATSAMISGSVVSLGNNGATACDVYLSVGDGAAEKILSGVTAEFQHMIPILSPDTTYGYALSVSNNATTVMGAVTGGSFTTASKTAGIEPVDGAPALMRQLIQDAIDEAAAATPVGTVVLGEGLFEIDRELAVKGGVVLKGQGWEKTVIRPATGVSIRCATLTDGARLEGVTLTGGSCAEAGAGVLVMDGTVSWCCVSNNATTGGGTSGGGVSFTGGRGKVDHSVIAGNTIAGGSWGAGVGGKAPVGPVAIDVCLIWGNEDLLGSGGGIGFQNAQTEVTVRNCTVTDNKCSNGNGHGLYFNDCRSGANLVLVNTILADNKSGSTECNTFVAWAYFDGEKSSRCLITGTQERFNDAVYKDAKVRGLFADVDAVLSVPPMFVDASRKDYHLDKGSPAIRKGVVPVGAGTDLDGVAFATKPSLGCYECGTSGFVILLK